eukprot:TRINITY_DN9847_c0_g7_i1.p1 TRINITY_DN9847_c0_g7~~TRINITY_DN9847_c0_g7_i1.p1  ORF type:complete len:312 (-),score=58.21 TRINITY_DN9847_c0_g7_i1:85-1020(-)
MRYILFLMFLVEIRSISYMEGKKKRDIILCPFDNGIRVMQQFKRGIYGAAKGPRAIFSLLEPDASPAHIIPVDKLNTGLNEDTYKAHDTITKYIEGVGKPFLVLGGDHSITYPIVKGFIKDMPKKRLGLIYFDAHFDLRPLEGDNNVLSSGNSFYRILTDPDMPIQGSNIVVIGIQPQQSPIFKQQEAFAKAHHMTIFYRDDINSHNMEEVMEKALNIASEGTKGIYLSFDIDVLAIEDAPGASAPSVGGLPLDWAKRMVAMGKFVAADIAEVSNREKSWDNKEDPQGPAKLAKTAQSAVEIAKVMKLIEV